jgi:hypothetical protein
MTCIELQTTGPLLVRRHQFSMLNLNKPEITNYKHQITNKFQITISKSQMRSTANRLVRLRRIGHCDLFGICVLLFEIFYC